MQKLVQGDLKLHAWVYKIETGEVFAYDPGRGQFLPISETGSVPVPAYAVLQSKHVI